MSVSAAESFPRRPPLPGEAHLRREALLAVDDRLAAARELHRVTRRRQRLLACVARLDTLLEPGQLLRIQLTQRALLRRRHDTERERLAHAIAVTRHHVARAHPAHGRALAREHWPRRQIGKAHVAPFGEHAHRADHAAVLQLQHLALYAVPDLHRSTPSP